ncbi:MAG: amino-acid N-acetyltransferase [Candidatus Nanopelagicales bacterium]
MSVGAPGDVSLRPARTVDIAEVRRLVDLYAPDRRLLSKATVTLYEDVQEFVVAELGGRVVGCGALHVMWQDLAEVRTLAVDPDYLGMGIGGQLLEELVQRGRDLGVSRIFVLTFEARFFSRFGFTIMAEPAVSPDVFAELLQSEDEGVAEFLDLERVKPNTLGNNRMILRM